MMLYLRFHLIYDVIRRCLLLAWNDQNFFILRHSIVHPRMLQKLASVIFDLVTKNQVLNAL